MMSLSPRCGGHVDEFRITPLKWTTMVLLLLTVGGVSTALLIKSMPSGDAVGAAADAGGRTIPDFTLPDLKGQPVNLKRYAAGRPIVISFGTTSCPYCTLQMKAFKEVQQKVGDRVAILEVNVGEPAYRVAEHAAQIGSSVTTLLDGSGEVYQQFGTNAVPVTVVANSKGRLIEVGNYIPAPRLLKLLGL